MPQVGRSWQRKSRGVVRVISSYEGWLNFGVEYFTALGISTHDPPSPCLHPNPNVIPSSVRAADFWRFQLPVLSFGRSWRSPGLCFRRAGPALFLLFASGVIFPLALAIAKLTRQRVFQPG